MRRALLIGINNYREIRHLRGCVNDVNDVRSILRDVGGFGNLDIEVLQDSLATKDAILAGLVRLTDGARPGDSLILHFAGHGSQILDRGPQDEPEDGLDELLCPHDMDWTSRFITDDELLQRLRLPAGVALEVVLDCCNSGDGQTEISAAHPPRLSADGADRFVLPPPHVLARNDDRQLGGTTRLFGAAAQPDLVLWSACSAFQTAADARIGGVFHGAFTFFLCEHLRATEGTLTRRELLLRVRHSLRLAGFSQVPELAATSARQNGVPFALEMDL